MISEKPSVTVLGYFDGVHLGHRALISAASEEKKRIGDASVTVLSFDSLPEKKVITPKKLRVGWLKLFGAEKVILEDFSAVKDMSPEEFVAKTIKKRLSSVVCICGYNYHFGKGGFADSDELIRLAEKHDIGVRVVPKLELSPNEPPICATSLRTILSEGRTELFYRIAGHHFATCGEVVRGRQYGRSVGLPTVNQLPDSNGILPPDGAYATYCRIDGKYYPSVTNIGVRPTFFPDGDKLLETHVIGFSGELYGKDIPVGYLKRIRGEKKFSSDAELVCEIERNINEAETLFREENARLLLPSL